MLLDYSGLKIVTDTVVNATKNSGLVATLVTRFLYDLDFYTTAWEISAIWLA